MYPASLQNNQKMLEMKWNFHGCAFRSNIYYKHTGKMYNCSSVISNLMKI